MYLCRHFRPLLIFCQQNVSHCPVVLILFFMGFRIRAVLGRHIKKFTVETIEEVTFSGDSSVPCIMWYQFPLAGCTQSWRSIEKFAVCFLHVKKNLTKIGCHWQEVFFNLHSFYFCSVAAAPVSWIM